MAFRGPADPENRGEKKGPVQFLPATRFWAAKRFFSFTDYELRPMVLSPAVQNEPGKVKAAGELENTLRAKLQPLLDQWKAPASSGRSGKLIIEPHLASLKIVSGGARFWIGAMAGDSSIDPLS